MEALRSRGACDICGTSDPGGRHGEWVIDHDHATGEVRGVLCVNCNIAVGHFHDDPNTCRLAALYLERGGN